MISSIEHVKRLRKSGLRPTKQRIRICELLFNTNKTFHFTINDLVKMISEEMNEKISLAIAEKLKKFDKNNLEKILENKKWVVENQDKLHLTGKLLFREETPWHLMNSEDILAMSVRHALSRTPAITQPFIGEKWNNKIRSHESKLKELKAIIEQKKYNIDLEIDGGINFQNSKAAKEAGANILVSGSTIFKENSGDLKKNINLLREK